MAPSTTRGIVTSNDGFMMASSGVRFHAADSIAFCTELYGIARACQDMNEHIRERWNRPRPKSGACVPLLARSNAIQKQLHHSLDMKDLIFRCGLLSMGGKSKGIALESDEKLQGGEMRVGEREQILADGIAEKSLYDIDDLLRAAPLERGSDFGDQSALAVVNQFQSQTVGLTDEIHELGPDLDQHLVNGRAGEGRRIELEAGTLGLNGNDGGEKSRLGGISLIQRSLRHAGMRGNLIHRCGGKSMRREKRLRRIDDLFGSSIKRTRYLGRHHPENLVSCRGFVHTNASYIIFPSVRQLGKGDSRRWRTRPRSMLGG